MGGGVQNCMGSNLALRGFGVLPQENLEICSAQGVIQTYSFLTKTLYFPLRGGGGVRTPDPPGSATGVTSL